MKRFFEVIRQASIIEKIATASLLLSIVFHYGIQLTEGVDIAVFGMFLAILYFPLGFIFLKNPLNNGNYLLPISLGAFFSINMAVFLTGALNVVDYIYSFLFGLFFLIVATMVIIYNLKRAGFKEYFYLQLIRVAFLAIINTVQLVRIYCT